MTLPHNVQQSKPVWKHFEDSVIEQGTVPESPHDYINLIALGRTGDGKSSLLNDLLGQQVFKQKISAKSQTKQIEESSGFWAPLRPYLYDKDDFGCYIRVTDTPGFGDSQFKDETFFPVIQNAIKDVAIHKGGVHAILMVFKITANVDTIMKSMNSFYRLISGQNDVWDNVLLVFTHVDIVNGDTSRYQSHKIALKTRIGKELKEKYQLKHDLPMLWISTQQYTCSYLKGLGDCDCERGARYHADCRRRLFEQIFKRRHHPFILLDTDEL
ncbi:hypothetical protein G6F57_003931 [Rhizopus arrhizus]|uniref:AIG1-type G domain-containing protein n=1 Tax=Rhizopus oryzae TaxID=64495 RepID=A0A9P7BXJ7_RHIOR|nr:hypothetical protein G6F23_000541 [Rhizopus arrhizus]KAG1426723.1 hypothetical protein G6F58_001360 [Rhizopus delemar]KAG0770554.1 hypothetical protein G6F24_000112 [Rhizopus arrhizus]KAG0794868.1 hypothetical protein G6F21_002532 [Rhizopus arrhizus]KAG0797317.1 hypothetical protein G6F22_004721 [Rhizopus arrhizus]